MTKSPIARSALAQLNEAEKAAVLDELVAADHELEGCVERAARSRLAHVETAEVASAVTAALLALDQEDLAVSAGRTRYGYFEPTEVAYLLLEAAVEPWLEDITRGAGIGLADAARRVGLGILEALQRIEEHLRSDDLLVSWAPDFACETADHVAEVLAYVALAGEVMIVSAREKRLRRHRRRRGAAGRAPDHHRPRHLALPFLRGPKVGPMWVRMLATPGDASISSI